jgi:hypothetical protein
MTSQTAYVLTEGSYSDYHIIGVYSTKELAEEAKTLWPDSDIEPFPLDDIPEHPPGMYFWHGCADRRIGAKEPEYRVLPAGPSEVSGQGTEFCNGNRLLFCVDFWAVDQNHAFKILQDKYHQHMAEKAGLV